MVTLVIGLVIFLGIHSFRIVSERGRAATIHRLGEMRFKGVYSALALIGLVLVVHGYGAARIDQGLVYAPLPGLRHLALVLVPAGFVLVAAAYVPAGRIKMAVRHPMVLGIVLWSLGHLLTNGGTADVVLFGAFFVWSVIDYLNSFGRNVPAPGERPRAVGDVAAVGIGLAISAAFLAGLHQWLVGVSPLT